MKDHIVGLLTSGEWTWVFSREDEMVTFKLSVLLHGVKLSCNRLASNRLETPFLSFSFSFFLNDPVVLHTMQCILHSNVYVVL